MNGLGTAIRRTLGVAVILVLLLVTTLTAFVGTTLAAPGIVLYLLTNQPAQLSQYPFWWVLLVAAMVLAFLLTRVGGAPMALTPSEQFQRAGIVVAGASLLGFVACMLTGYPDWTFFTLVPISVFATLAGLIGGIAGTVVVRVMDRNRVAAAYYDEDGVEHLAVEGGEEAGLVSGRWSEQALETPVAGEVWWAEVGRDTGAGTNRDRPCLVVRVGQDTAEVLKITTKGQSKHGYLVPFPLLKDHEVDETERWLEMMPLRTIALDSFRLRDHTPCPLDIWRKVQAEHPPLAKPGLFASMLSAAGVGNRIGDRISARMRVNA